MCVGGEGGGIRGGHKSDGKVGLVFELEDE